jgi:predicted secreted acid phosphatase
MTAGCASKPSREPANLSRVKAELVRYQQSGDYERGLAAVAAEAVAWIETRAAKRAPGERLAVVLDVDETVLSNWDNFIADDFGYISERWHAWVARGGAKALGPGREIFKAARAADVAVIFLTGRKLGEREATERNLRAEGMGDYAELITREEAGAGAGPTGPELSAAVFKTAVRKRLTEAGWTIVANVGDQMSDLEGGFAEKVFKLPNPFYWTE